MAEHPVVAAIRDRPEGARLALVIEGGGMRGAVSGGMALGLYELGLADVFDAAFGSSAGTLNAMWLISQRVDDGIPTWTDPGLNREMISRRRIFGRRPVVDVETLVETRYEQLSPGLFEAVLAADTELHPIATDVSTGLGVDLGPTIVDETSLRQAIRASATLPLLSGPPVMIKGGRYLDAGLSDAIPIRAAIEDGATHILVLRSRREGDIVAPPGGTSGKVTSKLLSRISPAVAHAFLTRADREAVDEDLLSDHHHDPSKTPYILSVRPDPDAPVPGRLERDIEVVRAGLEAGRLATHAVLDGG